MQFAQVSDILNAVAAEADIAGLAIAEYLPWSVIEFAKALNTLPLLNSP
jgi:arginase